MFSSWRRSKNFSNTSLREKISKGYEEFCCYFPIVHISHCFGFSLELIISITLFSISNRVRFSRIEVENFADNFQKKTSKEISSKTSVLLTLIWVCLTLTPPNLEFFTLYKTLGLQGRMFLILPRSTTDQLLARRCLSRDWYVCWI